VVSLGVLVASWVRPEPALSSAATLLIALSMAWIAWRQFAGPVVGAVRRGISPSWGAIFGLLPFVALAAVLATQGVRALRGG